MENTDTIALLRECDAGTKMAYASIDEVLDKVQSEKMRNFLKESKSHHEKLCDELHQLLTSHHSEEKEPNPMAKSMSWIKTNMKVAMDKNDSTIAELMTSGCDMGIKSLYQYLHQYKDADDTAKEICSRLIKIEEKLREDLQSYL